MIDRLDFCYHTHTYRCGHADGTDEQYVLKAIEAGVKYLGFTDHIFFPGIQQPGIRGNYELLDDYINSILHLKEKYKDKITIYLGFEAEYFSEFDDYYHYLLNEKSIQYLILGQHNKFDAINNKIGFYYGVCSTKEQVEDYVNTVIKAMESGLFTYVAHPDIFTAHYPYGFDQIIEENSHRLIQAAARLNIPLELNLGQIRYAGLKLIGGQMRYYYPYEPFWNVVKQYDIKTILGIDAHSPSHFIDKHMQIMVDIAKKYQLNLIDRLKIE